MKPRESDPRRRLIADWLGKADLDIRAAEALLSQAPPLITATCFHAQQAAEKYLKALLTCWNIEVPKTHVLARLLGLIETRDAQVAASLLGAIVLTPYGVDVRYPGDQPEPSQADAREALRLARKVRDAVLPLLS